MKKLAPAVLSLVLLLFASLAYADGMMIGKGMPSKIIDPNSHSRDISEPTQKALIVHDEGVEILVLQVSYKGDVSEFAWLVPTPSKPEVRKVTDPIFHQLHKATAPEVVYWFDADKKIRGWGSVGKFRTASDAMGGMPGGPGLDVRVLEQKTEGTYDIAVLKAGNANDLLQWLKQNDYQVRPEVGPVLADYINRGWVFTAMRINTALEKKAGNKLAEGTLQSLAFKFPSPKPVYPLKISSLNNGNTNLVLYVVGRHRVEEPLLKTDCCLDYMRSNLSLHYVSGIRPKYSGEVKRPYGHSDGVALPPWKYLLPYRRPGSTAYLTKFTADLTPQQMTHDLELKQAAYDTIQPPKPVPAPLMENIGALSLFAFGTALGFPRSFVLLGVMGLVALSAAGRKRWRVWLGIGIALTMVSLMASGAADNNRGADVAERTAQFAAAGHWAVYIALIALIFVIYAIYTSTRPSKATDAETGGEG